jgi:hypothetical protein
MYLYREKLWGEYLWTSKLCGEYPWARKAHVRYQGYEEKSFAACGKNKSANLAIYNHISVILIPSSSFWVRIHLQSYLNPN